MKTKRKKPYAANAASTKLLEGEGWCCHTVEKTIPYQFIKIDCYNYGDILACSPSKGIMLVQATGGGNGSTRAIKIRSNPKAAIWLAAGGRIQVHDWVQRVGKRGRECRILEITKQNP